MRNLAIALTIGMGLSACAGDDGSGQQLFAPPPGTEAPSSSTETSAFGLVEAPAPATESPGSYTEVPLAEGDAVTAPSAGSASGNCSSWCLQARASGCDGLDVDEDCESDCSFLFVVAPHCGSALGAAYDCALTVARSDCSENAVQGQCGQQIRTLGNCLESLESIDDFGDPPETDRPNDSGPSEPEPTPDEASAGGQ